MTNFKQVLNFAFQPRTYKGVAKSILSAFGSILNEILSKYITSFEEMHYDLSITPQVCFLEKMLNDKYDKEQRRIRIEDPEVIEGRFFFPHTDTPDKKFYFGKKAYFVKDTRYNNTDLRFIVVLPVSIEATDEMRALIDRYKLASVSYWIVEK
nr:MAG TPA: hypothetical protein [Caudoviricetes sp.]